MNYTLSIEEEIWSQKPLPYLALRAKGISGATLPFASRSSRQVSLGELRAGFFKIAVL
jgi:hypothetical protein